MVFISGIAGEFIFPEGDFSSTGISFDERENSTTDGTFSILLLFSNNLPEFVKRGSEFTTEKQ